MKNLNKLIFISGGGTGGHLFPAFSIGEEFQKRGIKVIYIGSKHGIEKQLFKENNVIHFLLNISGIQRGKNIKSLIKNITLPIKFIFFFID